MSKIKDVIGRIAVQLFAAIVIALFWWFAAILWYVVNWREQNKKELGKIVIFSLTGIAAIIGVVVAPFILGHRFYLFLIVLYVIAFALTYITSARLMESGKRPKIDLGQVREEYIKRVTDLFKENLTNDELEEFAWRLIRPWEILRSRLDDDSSDILRMLYSDNPESPPDISQIVRELLEGRLSLVEAKQVIEVIIEVMQEEFGKRGIKPEAPQAVVW